MGTDDASVRQLACWLDSNRGSTTRYRLLSERNRVAVIYSTPRDLGIVSYIGFDGEGFFTAVNEGLVQSLDTTPTRDRLAVNEVFDRVRTMSEGEVNCTADEIIDKIMEQM